MTEGSIIVVEKPTYSEIVYNRHAEDHDVSLQTILDETGGYLTVFSANVQLMSDTVLDKLYLNTSSSDSLARLSLGTALADGTNGSD